VCVKASGMKEPWHLAAADSSIPASQIIKLYSKRWTIEPSFRDSKDLRFGMGMNALRIDDPQRRDRLLLLNAFAILLLTIPWRSRNLTHLCSRELTHLGEVIGLLLAVGVDGVTGQRAAGLCVALS